MKTKKVPFLQSSSFFIYGARNLASFKSNELICIYFYERLIFFASLLVDKVNERN